MRHTPDHDYYSLGLLLAEIGIWDYIPNFLEDTLQAKGPSAVQVKLMKNLKDYLRHRMGEAYEQATMVCLEAKLGQEGESMGIIDDGVKKFEDIVIKALERDPTVCIGGW
ncbi:hypothetical protein CC86DRAFT_368400 [Ophiobolus disseminans]|uniref:Uncharacterized protein n=1 Tax=Ophiobolus disseminans TaxID=1469910 RepID=A0A6A7A9N0_9PLEO|nr:hypothetical protein CC86DRAFT_368400 [Ophiobolus disseminans]